GDHARAGAGGLEQHAAGAVLAHDLVGDRARLRDRHADHVAAGDVLALLHRHRHLAGLAQADPDPAVAVADDDHRAEAEPPAALVGLRRAADEYHLVFELGLCHQNSRPPSRAPSARALTRPWYLNGPRSNTTRFTPAASARSAMARPTALACAVLSPETSTLSVLAWATVLPVRSSMTWA